MLERIESSRKNKTGAAISCACFCMPFYSGSFALILQIAERLPAAEQRDNQRNEKINHSEPCKKNVEKTKNKIYDRPDPEIVVPMLLFHSAVPLSFTEIHPAGQVLAHKPHPTQRSSDTRTKHPFQTEMAPLGQILMHDPQATHPV